MTQSIFENPPWRTQVLDPDGTLGRDYRNYLQTLQSVGQSSPQILGEKSESAKTAAISSTPIPLPSVGAGYYRVSVYELITIAAVTSSSLQVTIGWTDQTIPLTRVLPAITSNTLGANDGVTFPIHIDNASPITYAVAYASNGANQMTYNLGILIEQMA